MGSTSFAGSSSVIGLVSMLLVALVCCCSSSIEAMAKGKVVFTGAETEWLEHYNLEEDSIVINALPNAEQIASKLEWLILNPNKIDSISRNARLFIEREHDYIASSKKYLQAWTTH